MSNRGKRVTIDPSKTFARVVAVPREYRVVIDASVMASLKTRRVFFSSHVMTDRELVEYEDTVQALEEMEKRSNIFLVEPLPPKIIRPPASRLVFGSASRFHKAKLRGHLLSNCRRHA